MGAIILAAGASSRLGTPKQLVSFQGEKLLDRSIRVAREAGCDPIIVVLGAFEEQIRTECRLEGVLTVSNTHWSEGMGRSIARGAAEFGGLSGVLIMTCDMPSVTADHIRALAHSGSLTSSRYKGRNGVPAYFPGAFFAQLQGLQGDSGAKALLEFAPSIPLQNGECDIDTPDDLARAQQLTGSDHSSPFSGSSN